MFIYYSVCVPACMPECACRGLEDLGGSVLSFRLVGLGAGIPVIHLGSSQHCSLSFCSSLFDSLHASLLTLPTSRGSPLLCHPLN